MTRILAILALAACGHVAVVVEDGRPRDETVRGAPGSKPKPVRVIDPDRPWLEIWDNGDGTVTTVTDDSCMRGCKPPANP